MGSDDLGRVFTDLEDHPGVPSDWTVAHKNGFPGHIANSVGCVQEPGSHNGYVNAVLTNGWCSWERVLPVVEEIAGWV